MDFRRLPATVTEFVGAGADDRAELKQLKLIRRSLHAIVARPRISWSHDESRKSVLKGIVYV